jgi:hypothetical protein
MRLLKVGIFCTRPSNRVYVWNGHKQEIFWDQEFLRFVIFFSSYHSSGWVPTSSAEVFVQEAHAQYWTLAARQNEYYPQVSQWVEEFQVQERAAEQLATCPVCP